MDGTKDRAISDRGPQMKYCEHSKQQYQITYPLSVSSRNVLLISGFVR